MTSRTHSSVPRELPIPVRSITGINSYTKLTDYLGGDYTDPVLGTIGQPAPGDHVCLDDGNYAGAALTLSKHGTATNPIVFRASKKLRAVVMTKITVSGNDIYLYGLKFDFDTTSTSNRCGRVIISGALNSKILRCEFTGWWDETNSPSAETAGRAKGHAITFFGQGGGGTEIGYCFIHDPHNWSDQERAATGALRIFLRSYANDVASFHKGVRIHHCVFASTIPRPSPSVLDGNGKLIKRYGSGQPDLLECGDNSPNFPQPDPNNPTVLADWTVEDCIFDATGAGFGLSGDVDLFPSGVVDLKIGGVTFKRCTFRNFQSRRPGAIPGRVDIRSGALTRFESCWFEVPLAIQGSFHQIVANRFDAGGGCWIVTGSKEWHEYVTNEQQACYRVRCTGNVGPLEVGRHFETQDIPVQQTIIEAHTGEIRTQQDYAGTWHMPASGNRETGTVYRDGASETVTVPSRPLDNKAVGPDADLDGGTTGHDGNTGNEGDTGNAFALGPTYSDNWMLLGTPNASVSQLASGVTLTAGPTLTGLDAEHIQIVSKQAWADDFEATFDLTRLDASTGSDTQEAGLFYFLMTGDGTATHPANVLNWPALDGSTRFEDASSGFRMAFDPRGTNADTSGQIRLRYFPGNIQILGGPSPATQPGAFPFVQNTTYACNVRRSGKTFTFARRLASGGPRTSIAVMDENLSKVRNGRFIFRMMAGRSFKIENFVVALPS